MPGESPHVKESNTVLDSGFQMLDQWNLDSGFQSLVGFRILPVFPLLGARRRMRLIVERTLKNRFYGRFPFNLKFRKIRLEHQMEPSISVWSDRNIRDQLWRWSTLTVLVISVVRAEMSFPIWQNRCSQYRSFVNIKGGRTQTMVCG